ncbi:MAG: hypothetical protein KAH10_06740 [Flavobacteriales bacterium]|nr:hypothetical protein [Flavobacteriales bacterium]
MAKFPGVIRITDTTRTIQAPYITLIFQVVFSLATEPQVAGLSAAFSEEEVFAAVLISMSCPTNIYTTRRIIGVPATIAAHISQLLIIES